MHQRLVAELRYGRNIAIEPGGRFVAAAMAIKRADELNALLAGFDLERVASPFARTAALPHTTE